jgi:hypothetical protein
MKRPNPELTDEDNPELTAEDFARARPAREAYPDLAAQSARRKRFSQNAAITRGSKSSHFNHKALKRSVVGTAVVKGLDGRSKDQRGEIRRTSGNTLVSTLRKTYGEEFGREVRGNAKLQTLLERTGSQSLSDYLEKQELTGKMRPASGMSEAKAGGHR